LPRIITWLNFGDNQQPVDCSSHILPFHLLSVLIFDWCDACFGWHVLNLLCRGCRFIVCWSSDVVGPVYCSVGLYHDWWWQHIGHKLRVSASSTGVVISVALIIFHQPHKHRGSISRCQGNYVFIFIFFPTILVLRICTWETDLDNVVHCPFEESFTPTCTVRLTWALEQLRPASLTDVTSTHINLGGDWMWGANRLLAQVHDR